MLSELKAMGTAVLEIGQKKYTVQQGYAGFFKFLHKLGPEADVFIKNGVVEVAEGAKPSLKESIEASKQIDTLAGDTFSILEKMKTKEDKFTESLPKLFDVENKILSLFFKTAKDKEAVRVFLDAMDQHILGAPRTKLVKITEALGKQGIENPKLSELVNYGHEAGILTKEEVYNIAEVFKQDLTFDVYINGVRKANEDLGKPVSEWLINFAEKTLKFFNFHKLFES